MTRVDKLRAALWAIAGDTFGDMGAFALRDIARKAITADDADALAETTVSARAVAADICRAVRDADIPEDSNGYRVLDIVTAAITADRASRPAVGPLRDDAELVDRLATLPVPAGSSYLLAILEEIDAHLTRAGR